MTSKYAEPKKTLEYIVFDGKNYKEVEEFTGYTFHHEYGKFFVDDILMVNDYEEFYPSPGDYIFKPNDYMVDETLVKVLSPAEFDIWFRNVEKPDEAIELLLAELKKQEEKGFTTEFDYEINGSQQLLVGIMHLSASILGMPVNPNNSTPLNWNKELWEELLKYPSERELIIIASFAIKEWKRLKAIETNGDK